MREENISRLGGLTISKNARDFLAMYFLIRDLKEVISTYASGETLDIGCGNKPYEELFKGKIKTYIGCDVVQSNQLKVDVICLATALSFEDNTFDTVFSTQVIEHVDDPFKMLAEAARVLKKNGYLILSAPFSWELHEEPYDFYRYTKYGLESMLVRNGFELIKIKANGGKWAAIVQLYLNAVYAGFHKKKFLNRLLKGAFTTLRMTTLFNHLGLWLDHKFHDEILTLNYVVVAKKS
jgi:SAM-dependent methyltransferase